MLLYAWLSMVVGCALVRLAEHGGSLAVVASTAAGDPKDANAASIVAAPTIIDVD